MVWVYFELCYHFILWQFMGQPAGGRGRLGYYWKVMNLFCPTLDMNNDTFSENISCRGFTVIYMHSHSQGHNNIFYHKNKH